MTSFSSSYNSPANGRCEKAVQEIKKLLQKVKEEKGDWQLSLSEMRNCPTTQGPSPAQLFYSRQVRSCILPELFQEVNVEKMMVDRREQERNKRADRVTRYPAKVFDRDEQVWLQNRETKKWDIEGWIRGARPHGKSFIVETETGGLYLRNRKFIKTRKEKEEKGEMSNEGEVEDMTQQERAEMEAAGQDRGAAGRRSYASVAREAVNSQAHRGVTTRSRARKDGGFQAVQL